LPCLQGEWAVTREEEELESEKKEECAREVDGFSADITLLQESFLVSNLPPSSRVTRA